ncbi:MAG: E3 binding domain-containing protein, partial [Bacillota bacterium]|nr:E3 binding domain-containing protein [Bacillota bacterium]
MAMKAFHLPDLGEGMAEAEIVRWRVAEGQPVEEDELLVELETDKAVVEIPSPYRGILKKHGAKEGERLPVGAVLAYFEEAKAPASSPEPSPRPETPDKTGEEASETEEEDAGAIVGKLAGDLLVVEEEAPPRDGRKTILASPAVRRQAREMGLSLETIQGTGPKGRITQKDLEAALPTRSPRPAPSPIPLPPPLPISGGERIPLRGLRRTIAQRLSLAHQRVPQVTHVDEVDV